jgi:hypothetical protein
VVTASPRQNIFSSYTPVAQRSSTDQHLHDTPLQNRLLEPQTLFGNSIFIFGISIGIGDIRTTNEL